MTGHEIRLLPITTLLMGVVALALTGCGGGSDASTAGGVESVSKSLSIHETTTVSYEITTQPIQDVGVPTVSDGAAPPNVGDNPNVNVTAAFHAAPIILDAPDSTDSVDPTNSAQRAPHEQRVQHELAALSSERLTRQEMDSTLRDGVNPMRRHVQSARGLEVAPFATGSTVATYTPAQIRAAYGLPALPAADAALTGAQAAQLGAGQTLYIVDAYHDPNVAEELAAFNQKFALPGCTTVPLTNIAALPLAPAPKDGCTLSVVYSSASNIISSTPPEYEASWATEIALDVQWAHATAPLARIVLIEAADTSVGSLVRAVLLANSMGPGVVSMSFGAPEGSWVSSYDYAFTSPNMTYLAAAGDMGSGVQWPSASPRVVSVGATTMRWSGSGTRSETAWSGTGGGISQYVAVPAYQASAVPGLGNWRNRAANDVSFNGDSATGQYVAVIAPGSSQAKWISGGGSSLATPQWAGLLAIANAQRVLASKSVLGDPHGLIYSIAGQSSSYAANFFDINQGSHGSCTTCYAGPGYDAPSGIGSPNAATLLSTLTQGASNSAPVLTGLSVMGIAGTPLSFAVPGLILNCMAISVANAPAGMMLNGGGVVSWNQPLAGTYPITVSALDTRTGLSGSAIFTVNIVAPGPVITASALSSVAGNTLTGSIGFSNATSNSVSVTISGVHAGMQFAVSGQTLQLSWPSAVTGNFTLKIRAVDSNGAVATATLPVTVAPL
jgi:subtilase family serine protease